MSAGHGSSGCPTCGDDRGRNVVVDAIVKTIRASGTFGYKSLAEFWERYYGFLCAGCRADFEGIARARKRSCDLLDEAIKLDPANETARRNYGVLGCPKRYT